VFGKENQQAQEVGPIGRRIPGLVRIIPQKVLG
jgi:hypothetical protein